MIYNICAKPDSAILIPMLESDGEIALLFEKRSEDIDVQPGDVCFPGGRIEEGETPRLAMIREVCEELLIEPAQIEGINDCGTFPGPFNRVVQIFTGFLSDYNFTYSKDESAAVFTVPLSWFETQDLDAERPEFTYGDYYIWGFTARATATFIKTLFTEDD